MDPLNYYRFNVERELDDVDRTAWHQIEAITAYTYSYIKEVETSRRRKDWVQQIIKSDDSKVREYIVYLTARNLATAVDYL